MKKIAIDISYYNKACGYGVVTNNILKRLLNLKNDNFYYLISNEEKDLSEFSNLNNWEFVCTNKSFPIHKFFILPYYLKKYKIDTYFSMDQDIPFKKVCKYIIISHDIYSAVLGKKNILKRIFNGKTSLYSGLYYLLGFEKHSAKNADIVFCPSNNTKSDLVKYFKINSDKIVVTNWGLEHINDGKFDDGLLKKDNYILFPFSNFYGDFQYKLANLLIDNKLVDKIYFLKPAYINSKFKLKKNISIITQYISDTELKDYYKNAKLSIYLTSYDGFGFPPLESICYGTPVISNDAQCIPEILGNLGVIDNLDEQDFLFSIKNYLEYNKLIINLYNVQKDFIKNIYLG